MKHILISVLFFFLINNGFSQVSFGGTEGLKDSSAYPSLRNKINIQNMFIKMDSNDVTAYFARAAAEYQLGNYETCIAEQTEIIRRFPKYKADAYTNRGMSYCYLKNFAAASADLTKAKQLTPKDPKSYLNFAFLLQQQKDFIGSIPYLDTAIRLNPEYAKAFANRGFAFKEMKQYDKAIKDYSLALEIKPDYPEVYFNRGFCYYSLNKADEAIADYNKALQVFPAFGNSRDFYLYRSMAYEKKGDAVNAKSDRDRAYLLKKPFE